MGCFCEIHQGFFKLLLLFWLCTYKGKKTSNGRGFTSILWVEGLCKQLVCLERGALTGPMLSNDNCDFLHFKSHTQMVSSETLWVIVAFWGYDISGWNSIKEIRFQLKHWNTARQPQQCDTSPKKIGLIPPSFFLLPFLFLSPSLFVLLTLFVGCFFDIFSLPISLGCWSFKEKKKTNTNTWDWNSSS